MKSRLYSYLETNNVLFDYQFGFRHNHSTTLALIDVVDKLYENLDKHNKVIGIYLDLQKAFDTVNHDILLHKLHNYEIRGVALDWFRNYLSGRYQYTTVNGVNSELTAITCGVPQGSALGPVLFLVYVNDIKNAVPGDQIKLFADDTNLFLFGCTIGDTNFYSNIKLNKLCDWLIGNKLSVNIEKTSYMIFFRGKANETLLCINNQVINKVSSCRYLGVIIDDKLKWTDHINQVSTTSFTLLFDLPVYKVTAINVSCSVLSIVF